MPRTSISKWIGALYVMLSRAKDHRLVALQELPSVEGVVMLGIKFADAYATRARWSRLMHGWAADTLRGAADEWFAISWCATVCVVLLH